MNALERVDRITRNTLAIALALGCTSVRAEESATYLTGGWGGIRSSLIDRGLDLSLGYVSEVANNPRGGERDGTRNTDQWTLAASLDLEKLLGWNDAHFKIAFTERNGRDLDNDARLGTLQQVQEVWGRGQTGRLTQLWYEQSHGAVDWKLGRMTVGEDFLAFSCDFQNLTFCGSQPGNVRGDYWFNWPVSQWAARIKVTPNDQTEVLVGTYQVNPRYADDRWASHHGFYPDFPSGTTGALIPVQFGWLPTMHGLKGSYRVGVWYDTSNAPDVYLDVNREPIVETGAPPLERNHRDGAYLTFEQQATGRTDGRGAHLFLNATWADRDTSSSIARQIAAGLQFIGPFASRPNDAVGVALGSSRVNDRVAKGQRLQNTLGSDVPVQHSEYVLELFYGWQPVHYLTLRPNLQFVKDPGGTSAHEDVVVIGLKSLVTF